MAGQCRQHQTPQGGKSQFPDGIDQPERDVYLAQDGGSGRSADQDREQPVACDQHQCRGGQRDSDPQQCTDGWPVQAPRRPPSSAQQQSQTAKRRADGLLEHHCPAAGPGARRPNADHGAQSLTDHRAQGEAAVGAFPRQQPLNDPGGPNQRQRRGENQGHGHQTAILEQGREAPAGCGLNHHRNASHPGRCPKGAGEYAIVNRMTLHEGVGEQRVRGDPQDDMHGDDRRTNAQLCRSDNPGHHEGRDDGQDSGQAGLQSRPERITPHSGRFVAGGRRNDASDTRAMKGGSHMMRA